MSSHATEIACYWWNTQKRDTANQRAELVLNWLSLDTKQLLQDCARSSTVASDACPFTVLFSRLAESFSRLWLTPKDIEEEDGLPEGLSTMLFVYAQMAGTDFPTSEGELAGVVRIALRTVEIMQVAEMQRLEKRRPSDMLEWLRRSSYIITSRQPSSNSRSLLIRITKPYPKQTSAIRDSQRHGSRVYRDRKV
jgi:hypothetical protein